MKVEISLCGSQLGSTVNKDVRSLFKTEVVLLMTPQQVLDATFNKYKVSFDDFCNNPAILMNPDLVFKIQDRYLHLFLIECGLIDF